MRGAGILGTCLALLIISLPSEAQDYVRLRSGRVVKCAVLRQDTSAVFTTDWELRGVLTPPLQVYSRDEVQSIWFVEPTRADSDRISYAPFAFRWEIGGGGSVQSWSGTGFTRRGVVVLSAYYGMSVAREAGFEVDADVTIPFSGRSDPVWKDYGVGYQVTLNALVHPVQWQGMVPFILVGGGSARDVPVGSVILTDNQRDWNLINYGLGVKWGSNGIGYRIEWRHSQYSRKRDIDSETDISTSSLDRSADTFRVAVFLYM
ncbi:hypothetical protein KKH27_10870 [bacterium]|nr:hypothetical protein [bacterium]MBU1983580.1 hypothetical protein [bacterium]